MKFVAICRRSFLPIAVKTIDVPSRNHLSVTVNCPFAPILLFS